MADKSAIEWTDATWNPVRGCSRITTGCGGPNHEGGCYAEKIAARFSSSAAELKAEWISEHPGEEPPVFKDQPFHGFAVRTPHGGRWTGKLALIEDQLTLPLRWKKPRRIFANSMSDLFHENLADEEIAAVFGVMQAARRHTLQVLTKRADRPQKFFIWLRERHGHLKTEWVAAVAEAERMCGESIGSRGAASMPVECLAIHHYAKQYGADIPAIYDRWPLPNVWLGVSAERQQEADERIPHLLRTPAALRFVSLEPLLGPIDLARIPFPDGDPRHRHDALTGQALMYGEGRNGYPDMTVRIERPITPGLDWIIIGGESGKRARPFNVEWADSLVAQCTAANVACFVKQLGAVVISDGYPLELDHDKGGDWNEWPDRLRVRQFPEVRAA